MTQEGRVEDFWTAARRDRPADDNVRPLLQALAAARRSLDDEHTPRDTEPDAIVLDLRPDARAGGGRDAAAEFVRPRPDDRRPDDRDASRAETPDWIMVEPDAAPAHTIADHPAPHWGDLWRESVQGWVRSADGTKVWRPIVTTTTSVPNWDIDSNLGMVTGESACALDATRLGTVLESGSGSEPLQRELARDRRMAQEAMVREAVARGAHAVIGVNLDYTPLGEYLIVTATGTAVTLRIAR
jgi:uncharacterized protein YbjQ (UPF0145 family)